MRIKNSSMSKDQLRVMTDYHDLVKANESPFIRCLTCSKVIGNTVATYRLLKRSLADLMKMGNSGQIDDHGEAIMGPSTLNQLQQLYNTLRQQQMDVLTNVKLNTMEGLPFDKWTKLELFPKLKELANMYKVSVNRKESRQNRYDRAIIKLRSDHMKTANMEITAANAAVLNFDDESVLEGIVQLYAKPEQLKNPSFMQMSIRERLNTVHFPFEENDPKWQEAIRDIPNLAQLDPRIFINIFNNINNIPHLIIIPETKFTRKQFIKLRGVREIVDIAGNVTYQRMPYSRYGDVAYEILHIKRFCCRMYIGEPIILPGEVKLTQAEIQETERRNPKILILNRTTAPENRPTTATIKSFMGGKITSAKAFSRENTYKGLLDSTPRSVNVSAVIADITTGNNTVIEDAPDTGSINNLSGIAGASVPVTVQPQMPYRAPPTGLPAPVIIERRLPQFVGGVKLPLTANIGNPSPMVPVVLPPATVGGNRITGPKTLLAPQLPGVTPTPTVGQLPDTSFNIDLPLGRSVPIADFAHPVSVGKRGVVLPKLPTLNQLPAMPGPTRIQPGGVSIPLSQRPAIGQVMHAV